ncbi:hypothetical protein [Desertibaculum subflavum]|uniref:hypothetical protein n=1 Tax=Desertibaculum subflavum TaxID=2268458 RepID=UPI000E66B9F8
MVRRFLSLLIALTIAFAMPSIAGGAPVPHVMAAKTDCACLNADSGCGEHGMPGCQGALACAVQCGAGAPMLGVELGAAPSAETVATHLMTPASPLVSAAAAPPFRPPTASIPA